MKACREQLPEAAKGESLNNTSFNLQLSALLEKRFGDKAATALSVINAVLPPASFTPSSMPLKDFLTKRHLALREISTATAEYYKKILRGFDRWLGREATVADLNEQSIKQFLRFRSAGVSASYVTDHKDVLMALWSAAARAGLVEARPGRFAKSPELDEHRIENVRRRLARGAVDRRSKAWKAANAAPAKARPPIVAYVDQYALTHDLEADSVYQLRRSATIFGDWLGKPTTMKAIKDDDVSRFLLEMKSSYATATLRKMRGDLIALLKDAAEAGLRGEPKKIRRIAKPKPCPKAWTLDQIAAIVAAAFQLPGTLKSGVSRATYYATIILFAWDTGLRRSDLWRLRQSDVGEDGRVCILQRKTGDQIISHIRPGTLRLFRSIPDAYPLGRPGTNRNFYYWWKKIIDVAGVPKFGGLHAIRRSASTDVARSNPGAETRFLGHTTAAADVFYIDRTLLASTPVMPAQIAITDQRQASERREVAAG